MKSLDLIELCVAMKMWRERAGDAFISVDITRELNTYDLNEEDHSMIFNNILRAMRELKKEVERENDPRDDPSLGDDR